MSGDVAGHRSALHQRHDSEADDKAIVTSGPCCGPVAGLRPGLISMAGLQPHDIISSAMLPSSRIELAVYRHIKPVGSTRSVTIGALATAIQQHPEDVAERLKYLHSEGHILMWKFAGPKRVGYSEHGNVLFSAEDFLFTAEFEVEITPSGRKYFEELEAEGAVRSGIADSARTNPLPKAEDLIFETPFHSYRQEGPPQTGGAGVVYRVQNEDGESYATKHIDPHKATSQKRKRFEQELHFCKNENHKNIVKVLDEGFTTVNGEKCPFYVMPFYPKTLRNLITEAIPHEKIMNYFNQILDGVEAAHLQKVCHRDLKPENVLYDPRSDTLVVADFGIAHFEEEALHSAVETKDGERLANFQYAAPEQRVRGKKVDYRADIYAVGLILNEMFTHEILQGVGYRCISSMAPQFEFLDEIVEWMVQQSPERRPESIDALKGLLLVRGDQFVSQQKLSTLRNRVIPASQIDDPLINDPVQLVDTDYRDGKIIFKLSQPVNQAWAYAFANQFVQQFMSGLSPQNFRITGITASVAADERLAALAVDHFTRYLEGANSAYKRKVEESLRKKDEGARRILQSQIDEERKRQKILKVIKSQS